MTSTPFSPTPDPTSTSSGQTRSATPRGGSLLKTPLHGWHAAHGGKLVDFAGWSMPVHYGSIVSEHQTTRAAAGLFDVSHMGRLRFAGASGGDFLEQLLTRRVADMAVGQVRYALVTNEAGGILDDVLVYRLADQGAVPLHMLVVNASNRQKILNWVRFRLSGREDVLLNDVTRETAMIAVQGPLALGLVQPLVSASLAAMKYYHGIQTEVTGQPAIVSRTGYTGEDGFELTVPAEAAVAIWEKLLSAGKDRGVMAAGLGARDTLRLEAAMPLYGHELSEEINPLEAGLAFAVNLEGRVFPGRDALAKIKQAPVARMRVGLELGGKRVPREHYPILHGPDSARVPVGEVTSGTFSPTFDKPIAMGYIRPDLAQVGTELFIDIRGQAESARVVKLPFYRRREA
jgi:aminomethyltransferase